MAKGNMLQGQATGKVGDIVFMVRNGQQISRVYTASGGRSGDQASIAVRRQRVRFGAASNQYLLYRNIIRGMYRTGKQTRQSDYNYFVRENVDLLPYLTKDENAAGVKCAMPGTFSRGTLGNITYDIVCGAASQGSREYALEIAGLYVASPIRWSDTVATLKTFLKSAFPNARKVNFSMCYIIKSEVETPSGTQWSHTLDRGDVIFDLYEEDSAVNDNATILEYFEYYAPSALTSLLSDAADDNFVSGEKFFWIRSDNPGGMSLMDQMYVMIFATNDQVGDCYTSTLAAITVPDSDGGLSLWDELRTDNHRQVAEDSYGYSTGVMRTNIQQA